MSDKLSQIFKNISQLEPPKSLSDAVFQRIEKEKERKIRTKLYLSYVGLLSSFLLTFWIVFIFGNSFVKSEFWSMFSLIFSDALVVASNWQEYVYSLMETFPVINMIIFLIPIFSFLMFLNLGLSFRNKYKHIDTHFKFA